ncbi:Carbamoyl-phosphate synthase L chain ATP-binding protein [Cellulomonas fimi ATCC 484]|uniref:biotin carboxylase n=1 Tax=Cellulomonas fimi (strain ATCC 484 / DSM 20113 / JCM 1341 / CCUG 24087 / LMG 16345 / NBRC 15513 / NCIMB 8980 / NCTC 7547 / NRS-133) TaxID=590998 RepID=F4H807_CELFA|nr:Carbamoyl-phosphate synthase L chain ATP-binding protein [Cellulomonas fimi ATCC 484]VEH34719.1 Acetyl-/propionyl-coenzyme A carboxylase alpha chain [Cellulomonas fimi]
MISKVLIANRGEIAVRIARACRDARIGSVAVYSDPDREALHVRVADEAFALGGARAAETYLVVDKLLDVARRSGADAVHPGYGFLAENADFARAVIEAGLVWIGPPPSAIESLGDKVSARHIAQRAGAPLVPGTADPVAGVDEIHAFVAEHGLPVAIKAAFGGGGRGLKVVRSADEIDEAYESAVREAVAAFGRGECFVERYLDKPRHVETQCLADQHGTVVVVSTRDCSLQRRHQKLVEEAPAPFLTDAQRTQLVESSVAILREAGYVGAGTCEFLVGADGTVSFLEVNTRLQVEHPVTEEISGIDLVREQLRVAAGEPLGYDHVETRGHSLEFRINGEDPARGFLPAPGRITTLRFPSGPGVRVDSGVVEGDSVSGLYDSMIAKLVVTGATRTQAVERARRALAEIEVVGIPTVVPFHRAVLDAPEFAPADPAQPFSVHTRWIETEFADRLGALGATPAAPADEDEDAPALERVVVEVGGKRLEVVLPAALALGRGPGGGGRPTGRAGASGPAGPRRPVRRSAAKAGGGSNGTTLASPMQGTIVKVAVAEGAQVAEGDLVVVLEAMKMEQPLVAHRAGTVTGLAAGVGSSVSAGTAICEIVG